VVPGSDQPEPTLPDLSQKNRMANFAFNVQSLTFNHPTRFHSATSKYAFQPFLTAARIYALNFHTPKFAYPWLTLP